MITILVNNVVINCICLYIYITYLQLVGGLEPCNFMTFHILGIITPTDELIFFRGVGQPPSRYSYMGMGKNRVPLVNPSIAGISLDVHPLIFLYL